MSNLLIVLIDGINYAAWLFISAVGLTLIYGVMRVLNVAHASFYAFGCYVAVTLAGYWFSHNYPPHLSFFALSDVIWIVA
jgi:branched-chain amino acid transport system permease protein